MKCRSCGIFIGEGYIEEVPYYIRLYNRDHIVCSFCKNLWERRGIDAFESFVSRKDDIIIEIASKCLSIDEMLEHIKIRRDILGRRLENICERGSHEFNSYSL